MLHKPVEQCVLHRYAVPNALFKTLSHCPDEPLYLSHGILHGSMALRVVCCPVLFLRLSYLGLHPQHLQGLT